MIADTETYNKIVKKLTYVIRKVDLQEIFIANDKIFNIHL